MRKIRKLLRNWLGITSNENRIMMIEYSIYHEKSRVLGYAILKKHLNRPDKPVPYFWGKEIEQD